MEKKVARLKNLSLNKSLVRRYCELASGLRLGKTPPPPIHLCWGVGAGGGVPPLPLPSANPWAGPQQAGEGRRGVVRAHDRLGRLRLCGREARQEGDKGAKSDSKKSTAENGESLTNI